MARHLAPRESTYPGDPHLNIFWETENFRKFKIFMIFMNFMIFQDFHDFSWFFRFGTTKLTRPGPIPCTSTPLAVSRERRSRRRRLPGAVLMRACMLPILQVTPILFLENMKNFENS